MTLGRRFGLVLAVGLLAACVLAATAQAATVTKSGCVAFPPAGFQVTLAGSGFAPNSPIVITWMTNEGLMLSAPSLTDETGSFTNAHTVVFDNPDNPASPFPVSYTVTDGQTTATLMVASCQDEEPPPPPPNDDLPTSKEECKDDGWQTFEVFKNQGDCVAFVATEGKNEPGQNVPTPQEPAATATTEAAKQSPPEAKKPEIVPVAEPAPAAAPPASTPNLVADGGSTPTPTVGNAKQPAPKKGPPVPAT